MNLEKQFERELIKESFLKGIKEFPSEFKRAYEKLKTPEGRKLFRQIMREEAKAGILKMMRRAPLGILLAGAFAPKPYTAKAMRWGFLGPEIGILAGTYYREKLRRLLRRRLLAGLGVGALGLAALRARKRARKRRKK